MRCQLLLEIRPGHRHPLPLAAVVALPQVYPGDFSPKLGTQRPHRYLSDAGRHVLGGLF